MRPANKNLILYIPLLIIFSGCTPQIKYVNCTYAQKKPIRPTKLDRNEVEYLKEIFIYTYELEAVLEFCK